MIERTLVWKRAMDIAGSALALVFLSPLMLVVAAAVRLRLGSPILFRHTRPGLGERQFVLFKFRSMRDATDADGRELPDAERLTPFGRMLRSSSLDELPELWNVLKGEMSLVGPRPLLTEYLEHYDTRQRRRHEVRPGMTGWAQVNGRNLTTFEERFAMDVWYVDHLSLRLDLTILWRTVRTVLVREGIAHPGHVTMDRFTGTKA